MCSFIIANYICLILIKYDNRPRMESRSFHQSIIWCDHIVVADVCHSILRQSKQQREWIFFRGCFAEKKGLLLCCRICDIIHQTYLMQKEKNHLMKSSLGICVFVYSAHALPILRRELRVMREVFFSFFFKNEIFYSWFPTVQDMAPLNFIAREKT